MTLVSKALGNIEVRRIVGVAAVASITLGVLTVASSASAQVKELKDTGTTGDYGYQFEDDPLNAGGFGPNDATIRVRAKPMRTTLIRPRTSFIPEMLKSVENL